MQPDQYKFQMAIRDFQSARQKAGIQEVLARVTGKSNQLLSYDDVAKKLRLQNRTERGIQNIPLNAIVGSVGRYTDFTRTFLPLQDSDRDRWARVKSAMEGNLGLPPIEVYKVGEVYFVVDGNHRVSVAREQGQEFIDADVRECYVALGIVQPAFAALAGQQRQQMPQEIRQRSDERRHVGPSRRVEHLAHAHRLSAGRDEVKVAQRQPGPAAAAVGGRLHDPQWHRPAQCQGRCAARRGGTAL